MRADTLPPIAYVERIFYSSFHVRILAGVTVLTGSALMILPAIAGMIRDDKNLRIHAAFGTARLAAILAAALGGCSSIGSSSSRF